MSGKINILWVDDEIEYLKAHILFLTEKGFNMSKATNGTDALELIAENPFDLIFLDENMPGLSGLETLTRIKALRPEIPVVMITKSEEEDIMDQAIGSKIADYIIKPVNPSQILSSIKRNIDSKRLIAETTTNAYQAEFQKLAMEIEQCNSHADWITAYRKLVYWELELQNTGNMMDDVLRMQKNEANASFARFVKKNYMDWIQDEDAPLMSNKLLQKRILPMLETGEPVCFILIDNFRLDQWEMIKRELSSEFNITDDQYYSILPTATQYARNAIFSGLMPAQLMQMYPQFWTEEEDEGSKNQYESELLRTFFERFRKNIKYGYYKVNDAESGKRLIDLLPRFLQNQFNAFVFNFVDMLSHARTEVKMIKELAADEPAYRSLTQSWFRHSPLRELLDRLKEKGVKIVITTDHGTIKVTNAVKVVGDKAVNTNLRFKQGRNLGYNPKEVFEIKQPEKAALPKPNISTSYIFATNNDFFAYPNNFNYYVGYYKDTFQHGGISLEEMVIPFAILTPKK